MHHLMKRSGTHLRFGFVLAVALSLLAVGCGNDESTLSRAEFTRRADALCAKNGKTVGRIVGRVFGAPDRDPGDRQRALDDLIAAARELHSELSDLRPPSELSDGVRGWLAALAEATDAAEAQGSPAYWESKDDPWTGANAKAADLGLKACSG